MEGEKEETTLKSRHENDLKHHRQIFGPSFLWLCNIPILGRKPGLTTPSGSQLEKSNQKPWLRLSIIHDCATRLGCDCEIKT